MSLVDILQIERERIERERVVLTTVYERMKNRINMAVRAKARECIYTIPEFIPGYPLVDISKTMRYILKKLNREGFISLPISATQIYITWNSSDLVKLNKTLKTDHKSNRDIYTGIPKTTEKVSDRLHGDFLQSLIDSKKTNPYA